MESTMTKNKANSDQRGMECGLSCHVAQEKQDRRPRTDTCSILHAYVWPFRHDHDIAARIASARSRQGASRTHTKGLKKALLIHASEIGDLGTRVA